MARRERYSLGPTFGPRVFGWGPRPWLCGRANPPWPYRTRRGAAGRTKGRALRPGQPEGPARRGVRVGGRRGSGAGTRGQQGPPEGRAALGNNARSGRGFSFSERSAPRTSLPLRASRPRSPVERGRSTKSGRAKSSGEAGAGAGPKEQI